MAVAGLEELVDALERVRAGRRRAARACVNSQFVSFHDALDVDLIQLIQQRHLPGSAISVARGRRERSSGSSKQHLVRLRELVKELEDLALPDRGVQLSRRRCPRLYCRHLSACLKTKSGPTVRSGVG